MTEAERSPPEWRVLVLAPTARDAALSTSFLAEAGIAGVACAGLEEVFLGLQAGAGALVLTEEALADGGLERLGAELARQPAWSDLPVLMLTRQGAASPVARRALGVLGNVTLLERPLRVPGLISAARAALRARGRQYELREHLEESRRVAEALRESDRHKNEFLAMLAHELRNPLAPIRNGLYILKQSGASGRFGPGLRDMMERQVEHMTRLVDDLLDVSRILRGRIELRLETFDLKTAVARAVETAQPLIDSQRHELSVELPERPLWVRGDLVRLSQIFANLLNNAAKYTPGPGHIHLSARGEGGEAVVRVRDDGLGLAPEMVPQVFDLFTQAERSLDRSQGGLGLGLTLVKRLTEMHGGTVSAASEGLGRGCEFVVRLPASAGASAPGRGEGPDHAPRPPARRVLVVDDNMDAADSLAMLLRLEGHEVGTRYNGPAALEAARSLRPEVVFLDIGLPGMDGYEVARRLRGQSELGEIFLVAVTGVGQEEDRRRSREAGFDVHLTKPVDPREVARLLAARPAKQ